MVDEKKEQIDGKYFFQYDVPEFKPKGKTGKLLYASGYVTREYMKAREQEFLRAANEHIYNTVIEDRKALLGKLIRDIQAIEDNLKEGGNRAKADLAELRERYDRERSGMENRGKELTAMASKLSAQAKVLSDREHELSAKEKELTEKNMVLEDEIRRLKEENQKFSQLPAQPKEYKLIENVKDLRQEEIDMLMKKGYQFLSRVPNFDGDLGEYYVLVKGVEQPSHAALRFMVYYELESRRLKPDFQYPNGPDIDYKTSRGKTIGVEILTSEDLKKPEFLKAKVKDNKDKFGMLVGVAAEENTLPFKDFGFEMVLSYREFKKHIQT